MRPLIRVPTPDRPQQRHQHRHQPDLRQPAANFSGQEYHQVMAQNLNPAFDLPDIQQDIPYIQKRRTKPVNWGWYQEGYDLEASDGSGPASHEFYVTHHNGPQYFGYLANTPPLRPNFHGLTDFFTDMANNSLPQGGVFYIRGGYGNQMGLSPPITAPNAPPAKCGNEGKSATTTTRPTPTGRSARPWRPA